MRNTAAWFCVLILTASACSSGSSGGPAPGTGSSSAGKGGTGKFTADPVQLTTDPCTLVTKAEAEALIGPVVDTPGTGSDGHTCVYVSSKNTGGQFTVSLQMPTFCKLLFLALDKNIFGGKQVRVDDVGEGGMQVKGNGNVQFVVKGGCVEVEGNIDRETKIDDNTMLGLAKTAAGRVS